MINGKENGSTSRKTCPMPLSLPPITEETLPKRTHIGKVVYHCPSSSHSTISQASQTITTKLSIVDLSLHSVERFKF